MVAHTKVLELHTSQSGLPPSRDMNSMSGSYNKEKNPVTLPHEARRLRLHVLLYVVPSPFAFSHSSQ